MKRANPNPPKQQKAHMLGVGLDAGDGDKRLTRGPNFTLVGGGEETHAVMQETAIKFNEKLKQKGKTLDEVSPQEFRDILYDVGENIRR